MHALLLYNKFANKYTLIIDPQVIEDIFMQMNGYAIKLTQNYVKQFLHDTYKSLF